ncbi:MAG: hypothetical protein HQK53_13175 [Oligoflexia bacterium]|nr:hypothetical protein [Oligoflexia bacterium]
MKLELERDLISSDLMKELCFEEFLEKFSEHLPILDNRVLRPFANADEGMQHFEHLSMLDNYLLERQISLVKILALSKLLPSLTVVLLANQQANLHLHHLHLLANFIITNSEIEKQERTTLAIPDGESEDRPHFPSLNLEWSGTGKKNSFNTLQTQYSGDNFQSLKLSQEEEEKFEQISAIEQRLDKAITKLEQEILNTTKIKMVYPYPRELSIIDLGKDEFNKIIRRLRNSKCNLIKIEKKSPQLYLLDYNFPRKVNDLFVQKERLIEEHRLATNKKLKKINQALLPFWAHLSEYYRARQNITFHYLLIDRKRRLRLVWPEFPEIPEIPAFSEFPEFSKCSFTVEEGTLPILAETKRNNREDYAPLNLRLAGGANLLFGANLSGKTTALKTMFFLLWLVRVGMPIPAKRLRANFPSYLALHLKNSGNVKTGLSGFSDELKFLCNGSSNNDHGKNSGKTNYILVDELFQTTNPISGEELSKIFVNYFSRQSTTTVFFFTTHYPELLKFTPSNNSNALDFFLFRMLDNDYCLQAIDNKNLHWVEQECKRPLALALDFALPKEINTEIQRILEQVLGQAPGQAPGQV